MLRKIIGAGAVFLAITLGAALAQDKGGKGGKGGGRGPGGPGLTLTSPDFVDGGVIDDKFTQKGGPERGPSPHWNGPTSPMGTQTFVLLLHDPDVAMGKKMEDVTHWMVFNIPGTAKGLPGRGSRGCEARRRYHSDQEHATAVGYMGPGARRLVRIITTPSSCSRLIPSSTWVRTPRAPTW